MSDVQTEGWFWPTAAKKAHYDAGDGRALCGKWSRFGFGGHAEFQGDADSPPSRDDCATCRRKLGARKA